MGLGGIAQLMAGQCANTVIRKNTSVQAVRKEGAQYLVSTEGQQIIADHVVVACPPFIAKNIVPSGEATDILSQFDFFKSKIALHTDPTYLTQRKKNWSIYNTQLTSEYAEASVWYSPLLGARQNLFRSSVMNRSQDPRKVVAAEEFRHCLVNPKFVAAQAKLAGIQGRDNLWFAGAYCSDSISHDTALLSAVKIASSVAPLSPRLNELLKRF